MPTFADKYPLPASEDYLTVKAGTFSIIGRSVAGVETVITAPELRVSFDTGRAPMFACTTDFLALTHFHPDHAGSLPFLLGQRCLNAIKPLKILVPPAKADEARRFMDNYRALAESRLAYEIIPADLPLVIRRNLEIKAVPSFHCTTSTGYLVSERRKKLKPEFHGKSQADIVAARQAGRAVEDEKLVPLLAVSGDTTAKFLESEAARAQMLCMECTFFGDDVGLDTIRAFGHTHISDWARHADAITSAIVVMTHTSLRYSREDIAKACRGNLPESLMRRLVVFR